MDKFRFSAIAAALFISCGCLHAGDPSWWTDPEAPVVDRTAQADNHGVANVGQAKWMAQNALRALRKLLPQVANQIEGDLVGPGKPIAAFAAAANDEERAANRAPLLTGQLKAVVAPFYARLHAAAPGWLATQRSANRFPDDGGIYPWPANATNALSHTAVTTGQLKSVFALDFTADRETGTFRDDLPDLWEESAIALQQNGTITNISQINPTNVAAVVADTSLPSPPRTVDPSQTPVYAVEFLPIYEERELPELGYEPFDNYDGSLRYAKRVETSTFEIEDSPDLVATSGISATKTWDYQPDGSFVGLDDFLEPVEEGMYIWDYSERNFPEDYYTSDSWTASGGAIPEPLLITTTTVETRNWAAWLDLGPPGRDASDTQTRSGHEVHTVVKTDQLSKPFTFPAYWNGAMDGRTWTEVENPILFTPAHGAAAYRTLYGDVVATRMIRAAYANGLSFSSALVSRASKGSGDYGKQRRLKELRWRWIKFDESDPFTVHPVAPPEGFSKQFKFALLKSDYVEQDGSSPGQGGDSVPGIITLECPAGLEGWQTMDLSQYVQETPTYLDQFTFTRGGKAEVSLSIVDCKVYSADKFLAGSIFINNAISDVRLEFVNVDTGESLGTYGPFFGSSPQYTHTAPNQILSATDTYTRNAGSEDKVFFVRTPGIPGRIDFYTCFNGLGNVEVRLKRDGEVLGAIGHELKADAEFAEIIGLFDQWMKGVGFELSSGGEGTPLGLRSAMLSGANDLDPLVAAALIPVFNVIGQVEGLTALLKGFVEGVKAGFNDDWMFLVDISTGLHLAGDWASTQANNFLLAWRDNPELRKAELILAINEIADDWVVQPLSEVFDDLKTWDGVKQRAWRAWQFRNQTQYQVWVFARDTVWPGIVAWFDDFAQRMMDGGEHSRWITTHWDLRRMMPDDYSDQLMSSYTCGYITGYICEQIATGVVTGGSMTLGKMFLKEGASVLGTQLAKRTLGTATYGLVWLKRTFSESGRVLLQPIIREFYEKGLRHAGAHGLRYTDVPTAPMTEILENMMRVPGFQRAQYGTKDFAAAVRELPNIKKLFSLKYAKDAARASYPLEKAAALAFCMDGDVTHDMLKNFMKILDQKLMEHGPGEAFHEWADDFLRVARGSMSNFTPSRSRLTRLTGEDKEWLELMLSGPNPGYIWKFEEGAATGWRDPLRRGVLVEIDLYHTFYRKNGWTHKPLGEGLDFTIENVAAVQVKSLGVVNEGTISRMKEALRALAEAPGNYPERILDMRVKPGLDTASLQQQLDDYITQFLGPDYPDLDLKFSIKDYQFQPPQ